jgi:hypothetical protein
MIEGLPFSQRQRAPYRAKQGKKRHHEKKKEKKLPQKAASLKPYTFHFLPLQ